METWSTENTTQLEHSNITLEELNFQKVQQLIGGIIFVGILCVCGIVGNLHVLYIYSFRYRRSSNHRIFIICLACLDIVTCVIGMPFVIVDLFNPLTFYAVNICKVLRFINYFMCTGSALVLVVIAGDRYRKICRPFGRQMSQLLAKVFCGIALTLALFLSWPAPILYGWSSVNTRVDNITGVRCFTEDKFKRTKYQFIFNAVLIIVFSTASVVMGVLYSLVGCSLWAKRSPKVVNKNTTERPDLCTSSFAKEECSSSTLNTTNTDVSETTAAKEHVSKDIPYQHPIVHQKKPTASKSSHKASKDTRTRKTTLMLFIITVVYVCSFVPHLSLKIVAFVNKAFIPGLSFTESLLYNTFIWSFFINNMANPIIYGFCDVTFQREVKAMYKSICKYK